MKVRCGPTEEEWEEALIAELPSWLEWHDHFAWWPVRVGSNDCRWLETVERKYDRAYVSYTNRYVFGVGPEYRAKEKSQLQKEDLH